MFKWLNNMFSPKPALAKRSDTASNQGNAYADSGNISFDHLLTLTNSIRQKNDKLKEQKKREESLREKPISKKQKNIQHAMLKQTEENVDSNSRCSTPGTEASSCDDDYNYNYDCDAGRITAKKPAATFVDISEEDIKLNMLTLEQLKKEYRENSRKRCLPSFSYFWNKNAFFGASANVDNTIEKLRERAAERPEGTSAKTLQQFNL